MSCKVLFESADTDELFSTIVAPLIIGLLPWDHVVLPLVQRQLGHAPERIVALVARKSPGTFLIPCRRFDILVLEQYSLENLLKSKSKHKFYHFEMNKEWARKHFSRMRTPNCHKEQIGICLEVPAQLGPKSGGGHVAGLRGVPFPRRGGAPCRVRSNATWVMTTPSAPAPSPLTHCGENNGLARVKNFLLATSYVNGNELGMWK